MGGTGAVDLAAERRRAVAATQSVRDQPIQERRASITDSQASEILKEGSLRAEQRAEQTMIEVRDAMKMPLTTVKGKATA